MSKEQKKINDKDTEKKVLIIRIEDQLIVIRNFKIERRVKNMVCRT